MPRRFNNCRVTRIQHKWGPFEPSKLMADFAQATDCFSSSFAGGGSTASHHTVITATIIVMAIRFQSHPRISMLDHPASFLVEPWNSMAPLLIVRHTKRHDGVVGNGKKLHPIEIKLNWIFLATPLRADIFVQLNSQPT
eukprot:scaffold12028_cov116-Amphora_coffeaeformis.AAC.1